MLRLAVDMGYPAVRLMLDQITGLEHRELVDLMSVDMIGSERVDWHFARLYGIIVTMLGKTDTETPELTDWLLERLVLPKSAAEETSEEERVREHYRAFMQGFAARTGAVIEDVPRDAPTLEELEAAQVADEAGDI